MANTEGHRFGTVLLVGVVAVAAAFVVKSSYDWSRDRIAANERARVVARLNSVLDPALRSRDLTTTSLGITDSALLGSDDPDRRVRAQRSAANRLRCCSRASLRTATTRRSAC